MQISVLWNGVFVGERWWSRLNGVLMEVVTNGCFNTRAVLFIFTLAGSFGKNHWPFREEPLALSGRTIGPSEAFCQGR